MTDKDWPDIARLLAGWPSRADDQPDRGVYLSLLRHYEASSVAEALRGLVGVQRHRPRPSEIAEWLARRDGMSRREHELATLAARYEARHRAAGTWLEPSVLPLSPVEAA